MSLISDSSYYQDRVLGGLFSAANTDVERLARVREITSKLQEEHFTGKRRNIFNMVKRYFFLTYALLSPKDYNDGIKSNEEATEALVFEYQQLYISYRYGAVPTTTERPDGSLTYITPAEFSYAIKRLREQTQTDLYGEALSNVMQILTSGKTVDRKVVRGFPDAKEYYAQQLITIEHLGGDELAEGTVSEEAEEMKQEYASAKNGTAEAFHVLTGIREIDNVTGGGAPGELWMLTGFCQPSGELVLTEDGFKPIEQITTADRIPQQGKVLKTFVFEPKPIVQLKADGCLPVKFSWDHPIAVARRGTFANETRFCWEGCTQEHRGGHIPVEHLTLYAKDIQKNDLVKVPVLSTIAVPKDIFVRVGRHDRNPKSLRIPYNEALIRFCAAYVADGSLSSHGRAGLYCTNISFGPKTISLLPIIESAVKSMGISYKVYNYTQKEHTQMTRLTVSNKDFTQWIKDNFGTGALTKRIPGWVLALPHGLVEAFLDSYSDGSLSLPDREGRSWSSFNKQLMSSLILLHAKIRQGGSLQIIPPKDSQYSGTSGEHYKLTVSRQLAFKHAEKDFVRMPIKDIQQLPAEPVYGIETESGWYYAPFLVHNTAEGKTTECVNITYNAMLNGQNVVFGTAETLREQVRRRLICRHSVNPKFHSPRGISGDALKKGTLNELEEQLFFAVVDDLATDPSYGKFKIVQIPKRCTVDYFSALLAKYETEFHTHVAVWDELRLAGVDYRRGSRREELNDIITDAKQMAVNHKHLDDTTGVLLLAPYQVSRAHWQQALQTGRYDKSCLAETSEAEKTADLIWSHLQTQDTHDLFCQILKYRDGSDRTPDFTLEWRPEVCFIGSQASVHDDLLDI